MVREKNEMSDNNEIRFNNDYFQIHNILNCIERQIHEKEISNFKEFSILILRLCFEYFNK